MGEHDWLEGFVEDTHACMATWYDKGGNEVEVCDVVLTDEQIKRIAEKLKNGRCIDQDICMEYIAEELDLCS